MSIPLPLLAEHPPTRSCWIHPCAMPFSEQELYYTSKDKPKIFLHPFLAVDSEVTSWGGVIVTPGPKAYEKEEKPEGTGENMDSEESTETPGETLGENTAAETPATEGEDMETAAS